MISHIQSFQNSHEAWVELCKLYGVKDVVITMHLKDKLQSLKMRESNSVTKHIHLFQVILKQLVSLGSPIDDDAILSLMHSMPNSCKHFLSTLKRQMGLNLQFLITYLIQEQTLMKDLGFGNDNSKVLFIGKNLMSFQKKNVPHRTLQKDGGNLNAFFNKPYFHNEKKMICFYCKKLGHVIKDC
jgi:hypothetical protein